MIPYLLIYYYYLLFTTLFNYYFFFDTQALSLKHYVVALQNKTRQSRQHPAILQTVGIGHVTRKRAAIYIARSSHMLWIIWTRVCSLPSPKQSIPSNQLDYQGYNILQRMKNYSLLMVSFGKYFAMNEEDTTKHNV